MNRESPRKSQRHRDRDRLWRDALQFALDRVVGNPRDPELCWPRVRVLSVSRSGARFEAELRFRSDELYCCAEPGCFLVTADTAWWRSLRECLREAGDREPPLMSILIRGAVECGARLRVMASVGLPVASEAYAYTHGWEHEVDAR
jgi:hypothetical protein